MDQAGRQQSGSRRLWRKTHKILEVRCCGVKPPTHQRSVPSLAQDAEQTCPQLHAHLRRSQVSTKFVAPARGKYRGESSELNERTATLESSR